MESHEKFTIPSLIRESIEKFGPCTSLVFAGEKNYTYNDLGKDIALVSDYLLELGIKKGDKVAILATNSPNWGVAFFSALSIGAVLVPILPDFHSNEIKTIIEHSETKALFVSEGLYNKVNEETVALVGHIILLEKFAYIPSATPSRHLKLLNCSLPVFARNTTLPEVEEEDLATIIYTSGTTGNSKGVMLTHKNLAWMTAQCYELQDIEPADRFLSLLPLSHTLENTLGFLVPMKFGASVHYLRKLPTPAVLLPALEVVKPTIILSVPLIIEKIFKSKIYPEFQKNFLTRSLYKLPPTRKILHKVASNKLKKIFGGQVRFFGVGGSKLDQTVERFLFEGKFPYAIGYGLTETSPLLAGALVNRTRIGSTGPAIPGIQLRLGEADPKTGEGEIQAKGPNVMKGYFKMPELTKKVFTPDGWFRTGDRGLFDKDGYLFVKGRIKTMIVGASGENIYPEDIETVINKMRYVLESLVIQKKGKLVALIHLNMEEVEAQFKNLKSEARSFINEKTDEILLEIQRKVNLEVNKFSRLSQVVLQPSPFEKTPTKKIKRFLYA
jgi:long-chain acyl-CoA synthetase